MKRIIATLTVLISFVTLIQAQENKGAGVVQTAVPFLNITTDSRSGALGEAGAATTPDIASQAKNPAKYAFTESTSGIALSYTPWLKNLGISDMNIAHLFGYHKLDDLQTVSASLRYFNLGEFDFYDRSGDPAGGSNPNEFAFDMGYALKLTDNWSGSVALRYIMSDIYQNVGSTLEATNSDLDAGHAFASDVSFFYNKPFYRARKQSNIAFGLNISNIGSKISYDGGEQKDFIPTNLKIGGAYTTEIDQYNKVSFALDVNKLLVPTLLEEGMPKYDETDPYLQKVGPIEGIFRSFADAPMGFKEELREITISTGVEYWYNEQFALRAGYFHESGESDIDQDPANEWKNKGGRRYLSFGAGLKMNVFVFDFSYMVSVGNTNNALSNTLRFTLGYDIDNFRRQGRRR
ncbi:MAG: type IX secretion system outer membrane channel protein PorV [Prolixibacteraceae bacterium]|nr:type IX secretion system outer membrane channel protein PorV [Prolixibacteraceae bacterium]